MLSFRLPSRKTPAHVVILEDHVFYISYETVVGYNGTLGKCRLHNSWGPMTGRHMTDWGIRGYPEVTAEEMNQRYVDAMIDVGLTFWSRRASVENPRDVAKEVLHG